MAISTLEVVNTLGTLEEFREHFIRTHSEHKFSETALKEFSSELGERLRDFRAVIDIENAFNDREGDVYKLVVERVRVFDAQAAEAQKVLEGGNTLGAALIVGDLAHRVLKQEVRCSVTDTTGYIDAVIRRSGESALISALSQFLAYVDFTTEVDPWGHKFGPDADEELLAVYFAEIGGAVFLEENAGRQSALLTRISELYDNPPTQDYINLAPFIRAIISDTLGIVNLKYSSSSQGYMHRYQEEYKQFMNKQYEDSRK